jgi:hypothetical protein
MLTAPKKKSNLCGVLQLEVAAVHLKHSSIVKKLRPQLVAFKQNFWF